MSLLLAYSDGVEAKTGLPCDCHGRGKVNLYRSAVSKKGRFDVCITMGDFMALTEYVLENTALEGRKDPRVAFVEYAKTLQVRKAKDGLRVMPRGSKR